MGTCDRAYGRDVKELSKKFHRPLKLVASIMPIGFTDEEYYETFKRCFPGLWNSLLETKKQYDLMDVQRKRQHLKPIYLFPQPDKFLANRTNAIRCNIRHDHNNGKVLTDDERNTIRNKLEQKAAKRELERQETRLQIDKFLQFVEPNYTNYFIDAYFDNKGHTQDKLDNRYRILLEASKFKCKATIEFMLKVNATESNYNLRFFAFQTLQRKFGFPEIKLKRNHHNKGKDLSIEPQKIDIPEKLMHQLYESQFDLEGRKQFDVFLSHSSLDKDSVFEIKTLLNAKGLSVYVDWIEDKESLKRELTSADTARVIIERIQQLSAIIYIKTSNSSTSLWTPWELGYALAIGKKICVLELENILNAPQYLDIYDKAKQDGEEILVDDQDEIIPIEIWIQK